jgi:cytochrome P450
MKEMLEDVKKSGPGNVLNEDVILAQGIVFFIAGFETSSNTLSSLTYNLAKNPEIQVRLFTIDYPTQLTSIHIQSN